MENWNSEWTNCPDDDTDSKDIVSELPSSCVQEGISEDPKSIDLFTRGNFTNSPTVSIDSSENLDDELHSKVGYPLLKTSIINASLAKRRLQAYSKQVRKSPVKEEKNYDSKHQKEPVKKTKKDLYPGEKAKAVIQEIEEIKRRDQEIEDIKKKEIEDSCKRLAVADAIRSFHSHHISDLSDRNQQFKRREIKQRNYRRTDSFNRKSPTPEDGRTKNRYSTSHKYPKDWAEYKKQKSTPSDSRGRYFQKKGFSLSLLEKLYNFDVPSPLLVPCRIEMEAGIKEIPLHSVKVTKSRPSIIYSVNTDKLKDTFPSRNQLYDFVSKERQKCIKDVISKHVKAFPASKKMMSQPWYNKQWRKSSFTECKVLEKSVGLSFLQNYSDEEDDVETEEIIICSNSKKNTVDVPAIDHFEYEPSASARNPPEKAGFEKFEQDSISKNFSDSKSEVSVFTPERSRLVANSVLEDESGILTPDISDLQLLKVQKNTGKSVEDEPIDKDAKSDLKKKKKKRKLDIEQSDDDSPKKKKKRKSRSKKSSSFDSNDTSCNGNKKKNKVKPKEKRMKKKKADAEESLKKKERYIRKKRKSSKTKSPSEDVKKKPKKKIKKQEEPENKKSSGNKELLKQKRVASEEFDGDLTEKYKDEHKNDELEKLKLLKKQKIKKEFALNEFSEKHLPIIEKLIKKEPEDDSLLKASTNVGSRTPDTNDYSGNWEKEDPSWESEEENVPKEKLKLNTSSCWESDEELYENRPPVVSRPVEKPIETNEMRDLEIPLNIKPFKKREIQIIKKDVFNIEVASKEEKLEYPIILEKVIKEAEKKRRWDKKDSKIEQTIGANNKTETTYTVLENEYEEFMKAVSFNTNSSPSCGKLATTDSKNTLTDETKKQKQIIIPPNDIPYIPMPEDSKLQPVPEEFKVQPVPESFKVQPVPEGFKVQPVPESLKLQPVPESFKVQPVPEEFKVQPVPESFKVQPVPESFKVQPVPESFTVQPVPESFKVQPVPESFKVQPVPESLILQPVPESFKVQPVPESFKVQPVPSPAQKQLIEFDLSPKTPTPDTDLVTTSLLTDKTKSFSFTTLMLPSKKVLIDNSNLKLGDSDDETSTVMKPIEDVKRELSTCSHNTEQDKPVTKLAVEKNAEIKRVDDNSELERSKTKVCSKAGSEKHQPVDKTGSHKRDSQVSKHKRGSPRRRTYSPSSREYSPRRRRKSPERYRSRSPASRRYHSRRHYSPHRRRTPSPRRRSPIRSASPKDRINKRISSRLGDKREKEKEKVMIETKNVLSSPSEGPKRSVADSTISDDSLLPQPNLEEYTHSPVSYYVGGMKLDGKKRLTLDERINLELGYHKDEFKPISTTYDNFSHNRYANHSQIESCTMDKNVFNENISSNFVQLGNMVEIVPTDLNLKTDMYLDKIQPKNKSGILQVGNVLQIVPTELLPEPPPLPPPSPLAPPTDEIVANLNATQDKKSAEVNMKQKIDERKAEREKRKLEREAKRREKEIRRREKEKRRQVKMKQKTENMIKKALQLEVENQEDEGDADLPAQWPPIHVSGTPKEIVSRRSILLKYGRRSSKSRKKVQFADGIKPGEGTSPSAGEDLTSPPPPSKVLPKEKRYTKTKLGTKSANKKVKIKIIKPGETLFDDSEEEDNLPPPSPPPGSPPPHVFPPRIKPQVVVNHGYVPNVITQSSSAYRPVNLLMMQPPLPDSPMQIHPYAQYQVPPLPPSASSLPPGGTESAAVPVHRNHFNYPL